MCSVMGNNNSNSRAAVQLVVAQPYGNKQLYSNKTAHV